MQCELSKKLSSSEAWQNMPPGRDEQKVCFVLSPWAPAEVAAGSNAVPQDLKIDQKVSHDHPAYVQALHNHKHTLRPW